MISGLSICIRISGLDRSPDVSSGFANGKVLPVGSACKSICKCKSSFQTDKLFFFSPTKIFEQSRMPMDCPFHVTLLCSCRFVLLYLPSKSQRGGDKKMAPIFNGHWRPSAFLGQQIPNSLDLILSPVWTHTEHVSLTRPWVQLATGGHILTLPLPYLW